MNNNKKTCYCRNCIDYLKTQGYKLFVGDIVLEYGDSIEQNKPCDWCEEFDILYEVRF